MSKKSVDFRLKSGTIAGAAPAILPDVPLPTSPDTWVNLEPTESLVPFDPTPAPVVPAALAAAPVNAAVEAAGTLPEAAATAIAAEDRSAAARVARYAPMLFGWYSFNAAVATMLRRPR